MLRSGEWRNWQTRRLQVPVSERMWGFKSPLAHRGWPSYQRTVHVVGAAAASQAEPGAEEKSVPGPSTRSRMK